LLAWIDLAALMGRESHGPEDVLNGIAYDARRKRLFVTGKCWSEIIEIKLESQMGQQ
jgi:glutaminyl-peptide cyclotransferase